MFHIDPITAGSNQVIDAQRPNAEGIDPVCSLVGNYGMGSAGLIGYCVHTDLGPRELGGTFDTTVNADVRRRGERRRRHGAGVSRGAKTIAVTSKLAVTGDKPLVLAALDTITVAAEIDLTGSAGREPQLCARTTGNGNTGSINSSGGAGGGGGGGGGSWQSPSAARGASARPVRRRPEA